jgi:NADH dehydrogenase
LTEGAASRVVIVGGGFAGLYAAQHLRRVPLDLTLVDRRNFHLFQPLLYQVATGGLSPADIAAPLRAVLKRQRRARVLLGEAVGVDAAARRLLLRDGTLEYDTLVLAAGARHHYFGRPEWEALAPGLKTLEDATEIRRRVLTAFEAAEREGDAERRRALLTFVVVGAGPTGVELAGALAEIARETLRGNFRAFDPAAARIVLVEGDERVLPSYPPDLSQRARRSLERLGVEVWTGALVSAVAPDRVTLKRGEEAQSLPARVVLWAAGVAASPLGRVLREATGCELDRAGRVVVGPDLSVPGHPEIFVIGDLAHAAGADGQPLPGVAPVAMQQGRYVARLLAARLRGRTPAPFRYLHKGSLATIGRAAAVADFGRVRFGGYPAWLAWLFIHLMYVVEFENRLLVFVQWAWNYFTRNRSARLITEARWPAEG